MRPVRRQLQSAAQSLGMILGPWLLRAWAATLRKEQSGFEAAWGTTPGPAIVVFWHSRFLMLPFIYPKDRTIGVLISPSRDGDLIASIIRRLGRQVVRGSSRRGGEEANREMEQKLQQGWDVGIAIDGPLGPAYECKMGAVSLAQKLQLPIVPLVYTSTRGVALNTWDKFWLPAPFSRTIFQWGSPIRVQPDADLELENNSLSQCMRALLQNLEQRVNREPPWAC